MIDEHLLRGTPVPVLAVDYKLHVSALHRHKKNHLLDPAADELKERQETAHTFGRTVLTKLDDLESTIKEEMEKAKKSGNSAIVVSASKELREVYKLQAQLTHQLATAPQTNITLIQNPAWVGIKDILLRALRPYPDATHAVLSNLKAYLPPQDNGQ